MEGLKILVIDDMENIRIILQEILQGHKVTTAPSGIEGLKIFSRDKFDLVITDRQMPGMLGEEVVRKIKFSSPTTKVIFMTASDPVMMIPVAKAAGADEFLDKGLIFTEMNRLIRKLFPPEEPSLAEHA